MSARLTKRLFISGYYDHYLYYSTGFNWVDKSNVTAVILYVDLYNSNGAYRKTLRYVYSPDSDTGSISALLRLDGADNKWKAELVKIEFVISDGTTEVANVYYSEKLSTSFEFTNVDRSKILTP